MPTARRALGVVLVGAVIAAACSGGGDDEPAIESTPVVTPTVEPTASSPPEPDPEPTATPEPVPTEEPTPEPTVEPADDIEVVQATWDDFLEGSFGPEDDAEHLALALANGTREAFDSLEVFRGSVDRTVVRSYAKIEVTDTGWVINDCFATDPRAGAIEWQWFSAVVSDAGGAPVVESVRVESPGADCVPSEIAEAAIAGYEANLDAEQIFWFPADPEHPLLSATATGVRLEDTMELLSRALEENWEIRGRPETHAYISELTMFGQYILSDCQVPSPDRGAFDVATGERLDDLIALVSDGQRDLVSVRMELDEGVWKVAARRRTSDTDCAFEPPADALPVVP